MGAMDDIEEAEVFEGIDLGEHDRTCVERTAQSAFRWWRCPTCDRKVDTFGGNVA